MDAGIQQFAATRNLPATRTLKAISQPRFWSAADPVMVISNTSPAHLLRLDPMGTLACRWPSEIVSVLNVTTGSGGPAFTVHADHMAKYQPTVNWTNLPGVSQKLFAEFFLLDPMNAPLAASAENRNLTDRQSAALVSSIAAPNPAKGVVPAKLPAYPWSQPWQPIYVDWELAWYPIPFQDANGGANWVFNGTDYDLVAGLTPPAVGSLSGRCVLTPKPSFEFQSRVNQYINDYPNGPATQQLQEIQNLVETVDAWDFLSQALGGLKTQLSSWSPTPTVTLPTAPYTNAAKVVGNRSLADLIGDQGQYPPGPQLYSSGGQANIPKSTFEGMRGGQFSFSRLTIIDAFGQTLEIVTSETAEQTSVIVGDGLQVTQPVVSMNTAGLAQVPPRLLQPARLNFQFSPQVNGNPILGWVLPNHIDGGLTVYGADGTLYGELSPAVDATNKSFVYWWVAPDSPYSTLAALQATQAGLGGMLSQLQSAGAGALVDFLRAVDETLWSVDPLGDRGDAFLSVMLGRPVAVVAATIAFELQAGAWCDPAWPYTFAPPDPLFLSYQFPVQLGNLASLRDGLLGYYVDGNYQTFNAVHVPQPGTNSPPLSGYLSQIGPNNWLKLRFAASGPGPAHKLILLMDPRAAVHAQCGILPTKDISLLPQWVDDALAAMKVTFRTGPALAEMRQLIPQGQTVPVNSLLTTCPAEKKGVWLWRQLQADGSWPGTALASVDGNAVFPDSPPILRDGVLQLGGGLGS
jgi:hypothetical protein